MSRFVVRDARRSASKARVLITSPSGGGKTYGALLLAKGMSAQRIVVIDTEHSSADKYDRVEGMPEFRVIEFDPPYTPESYIAAIDAAEQDGADVIIIDSTSHEWDGPGGCLELVEELAKAKYRGNTWSAWSEVTPRHRRFIERMLSSKAHVIATARSKTETAQVDDGNRKKVVKLGMKAVAREGTEYEFDVLLDVVHDGHFAVPTKDRTGVFAGDPKPITADTGRRLLEWLEPANELRRTIEQFISDATSAETLAKVPARIEALRAGGRVSEQVAADLLQQIEARKAAI